MKGSRLPGCRLPLYTTTAPCHIWIDGSGHVGMNIFTQIAS